MAGYTAAPITQDNQTPLSSVQVPGRASPIPLLGSPHTTTDTINNEATAVMVEQSIYGWQRQGQLFLATTGSRATATNPNLIMGASLFNPSSVKSLLVLSVRALLAASGNSLELRLTTADPAFASALTPANLSAGSVADTWSSTTCAAAAATASVTVAGTVVDFVTGLQMVVELLPANMGILLPAGTSNGVAVFTTVAAAGGFYAMTFRYAAY